MLARSDELTDALELHLGIDRADVGILVEGITEAKRLHPVTQLAHDDVVHALLDEEARARTAHVPLVEVDAVDDAFDRLVERRIFEHDVRRFAAQLERELLLRA